MAGWRAATKSRAAHWLFSAEAAKITPRRGSLLASNLSPFAGISNREHHLLERLLTYRKQTTAPRSNRELSTNERCFSSRKTNPHQSAFSALRSATGVPVLPFLPGSAPQAECDVTFSKQRTEEFLPGATT
jgi:hypothetical protein